MSFYYFIACFIMGLGIGLDVVLGTLSRTKYLDKTNRWLWIRRIAFTHIAFPMIGYYGFIELFYLFPSIRVVLGLVAFILILIFLFDIIKSWLSEDDDKSDETSPFSWAVVLTVSWDALFSGPAKSAQALNWNQTEVFLSFFLSGLVVTFLAIIAVQIAFVIQRLAAKLIATSIDSLVYAQLFMMFAEFAIFTYFGLLALIRYSFHSEFSALYIAVISIAFSFLVFLLTIKILLPNLRKRVLAELPT